MMMHSSLCCIAVMVLLVAPATHAQDDAVQPVSIGMSLPLSGPRAASGKQLQAGAQACLSATGTPVQLEVRDDAGSAQRAVANIRAMAAQPHTVLLLGGGDAAVTTALLPVLDETHVPMVGAPTGAESVRQNGSPYLFHTRASHSDESSAITIQLYELGINDIAVVYADSAFGREGLEGMRVEASRLAIRLVTAALPASGSFAPVVQLLAKAEPSAVVLIAQHEEVARLVRELRQAGIRPRFIGLSVVSAQRLGAELGDYARGIGVSQVMPLPWGAKLGVVRFYQAALKASMSGAPGYESLEACMYARVGAEAIKRAGRNPSRASVYAALAKGSFDLGDHVVRFDGAERRGTRFVEMTVIGADGRITR